MIRIKEVNRARADKVKELINDKSVERAYVYSFEYGDSGGFREGKGELLVTDLDVIKEEMSDIESGAETFKRLFDLDSEMSVKVDEYKLFEAVQIDEVLGVEVNNYMVGYIRRIK